MRTGFLTSSIALLSLAEAVAAHAQASDRSSESRSSSVIDVDLLQPSCGELGPTVAQRDILAQKVAEIDGRLLVALPGDPARETNEAMASVLREAIKAHDGWAAAKIKFESEYKKAAAAESYLKQLILLGGKLDEDGVAPIDQLAKKQKAIRDDTYRSSNAAAVALCDASMQFEAPYAVAASFDIKPLDFPKPVEPERRAARAQANCIRGIEKPELTTHFGDCLVSVGPSAQTTDSGLPDRPLRPRGLAVAFQGSSADSKVTVSLTDTFKRRSFRELGQTFSSWGYSIGLTSPVGAVVDLDRAGKRNAQDFTSSLDRLSAGAKVSGSISWNSFDHQKASDWEAKAREVQRKAYEACLKDRPLDKPGKGCVGADLQDWLLEVGDDNLTFKRPAMVQSYSDLYFGPAKESTLARWGVLLNGEFSRPQYKFVVGGKDQEPRRTNWAIGGLAYYRFDLSDAFDLTGAVSLTYKKAWNTYFASDETLDASQAPVRVEGFVPSLEARLLYRGNSWRPAMALSPKFSYDLDAEKSSIELPMLMLFGEKMDSSAGFSLTHNWGGRYDDGPDLPETTILSLIYQKNFSMIKF